MTDNSGTPSKETQEMKKYGITHQKIDNYHYKDYKYTSYADALAQAMRDEKASSS